MLILNLKLFARNEANILLDSFSNQADVNIFSNLLECHEISIEKRNLEENIGGYKAHYFLKTVADPVCYCEII